MKYGNADIMNMAMSRQAIKSEYRDLFMYVSPVPNNFATQKGVFKNSSEISLIIARLGEDQNTGNQSEKIAQ